MTRKRRRWLLLGLTVGVIVALGAAFARGLGQDPTNVSSALIHRKAPPLAGPTLDGKPFDLRTYRRDWTLVNVWASWCAACREEHPVLVATARELGPRGLRIVGIDMKDTEAGARDFIRERGGPYGPSVRDPDARIAVAWGAFAVPETYVVAPGGTIVDKSFGPVTRDWIRRHVASRLTGEQ